MCSASIRTVDTTSGAVSMKSFERTSGLLRESFHDFGVAPSLLCPLVTFDCIMYHRSINVSVSIDPYELCFLDIY